jgi:hypothetical protein
VHFCKQLSQCKQVPVNDVDPTSKGGYINPNAKTKLPNGTKSIVNSASVCAPNSTPRLVQLTPDSAVQLHLDVVGNEVGRAEMAVGSVQMLKKMLRCDFGVSCDLLGC